MDPQIELVCRRMAEAADLSYDNINWMDGTHLKLKWSESQEKAFKYWLIKELKTSKEMRYTMMKWPRRKLVRDYKEVANYFCNQYGFSYE